MRDAVRQSAVEDAENAATDALIEQPQPRSRRRSTQIEDYLRVGGNALFDNRVERILDSIKRDLRALARRAGAA